MNVPNRALLRGAAAWGALALTGACSALYPVEVTRTSSTPAEPRDAARVEVLDRTPSKQYIEVARLFTESQNYDSSGHAVQRLRDVAAEVGADAIIVERRGFREQRSPLVYFAPGSEFGYRTTEAVSFASTPSARFYAQAVAIRWRATPGESDLENADATSRARPEDAAAGGPFMPVPAITPKK